MKNTERKTSVRDYMRKRRSNEKLKSRDSQIRTSHSMTNTEKTRENNRIRMLRLWPPLHAGPCMNWSLSFFPSFGVASGILSPGMLSFIIERIEASVWSPLLLKWMRCWFNGSGALSVLPIAGSLS